MKTEEFNNLINQSVESLDDQIDYKTDIMTRIKDENIKPIRLFIKKYLIIAAIIILSSTTVYAGVRTFQLIELKNEENEVIGTVEVIETDENHHLDIHVSREEMIRFGDNLHQSGQWRGKSFIVIDSMSEYPYNVDLSYKSKYITDYSELSDLDVSVLLPMTFDDYTFESAAVSYSAEFPEEEEIQLLVSDHEGERFIVSELEAGQINWISYSYNNQQGDTWMAIKDSVSMSVSINIGDTSNEFTVYTSTLENYEVVQISDIDVFLIESDYLGVMYEEDRTIKIVGENHYETTWYEPKREFKVNVEPNSFVFDKEVEREKEIDGEMVIVETYPENTKEVVIEFTELIHQLFNE